MCSQQRRSLADPTERGKGTRTDGPVACTLPPTDLTTEGTQPVTDHVRTMHAMLASSPDPSSLTSESVPVPDPGPGELLVEVRATAITA